MGEGGVDRIYQGSALRRARMLARKSIRDTAHALGVTEGAISQWELGMSSPSFQAIEALASFYEMPMDTMLDRPGAPISIHEWYSERQRTIAEASTPVSDSQAGAWGDTLRQTRGSTDSAAPKPASRQRNQGFSRFPTIPVGAH